MKKRLFLAAFAMAMIAMTFTGCKTTVPMPRYVPLDKVLSLELGSTYDQVVQQFGGLPNGLPYDVISRQKDGYSIYLYKYRTYFREVRPDNYDRKGHEWTGELVYYGEPKNLYLFFNKEGKLMDIQTEEGLTYSADWLMINNTLYNIGKSGKGYNPEISPLPTKEKNSSGQNSAKKKKLLFF